MPLSVDESIKVTRWQIAHCTERVAEIGVVLQSVPPNSEREQALLRERNELKSAKRQFEAKLKSLESKPPPDPRRLAMIDAWLNSRREELLKGVDRREKERDYRDALIWRNEILNLPDQMVHELGL